MKVLIHSRIELSGPLRGIVPLSLSTGAGILLCFALPVDTQSATPLEPANRWEKLHLTPEFWAEGACVADVNRDGNTDVLCGPFWYAGPDFKVRHPIHPAPQRFEMTEAGGAVTVLAGFKGFLSGENGYSENFLSYSTDVNGDQWPDYVVVGFPGKETWWYQNPAGGGGLWTRRLVMEHTDNESPQLVDITGDTRPELLCMNGGRLGYALPNLERINDQWTFHAVTEDRGWKWNTHGLGCGDVNGDGRIDLITCVNWWEHPAAGQGDSRWKQHDHAFSEAAAQMFATDVNGDGLGDVIASVNAHATASPGMNRRARTVRRVGRATSSRAGRRRRASPESLSPSHTPSPSRTSMGMAFRTSSRANVSGRMGRKAMRNRTPRRCCIGSSSSVTTVRLPIAPT